MFNPNDYTDALGEKTPRYYQVNAANQVAEYLEQGFTRIEVIGPTGCGKTLTSRLVALSKRVRNAIGHTDDVLRVLFVSNRHRLNRQAMEEFEGDRTIKIIPQSAFSSIPESTINEGWDLVILDESHHEAMVSVQILLDDLTRTPIIGFTADNQRNDSMLCKFDRTVIMISEAEAAEKGYIEKAGINTVIDYSGKDKADLALDIVRQYGSCMGNTIAFFKTTEEVREFHFGLLELGFTSVMLDNTSSEKDLDSALDRLSSGEVQFLSNCQKVGEGIDTPNVSDVLLMRSFRSRSEKKQYIGRAIRPDSPCAVWELMNPLENGIIPADQCVGGVKYKRLITRTKGVWSEKLLQGEDLAWGQMSRLRVQPVIEGKVEQADDASSSSLRLPSGGGSLNLKELGIDSNTYSDKDLNERLGVKTLEEWFSEQKQLNLFEDSASDDSEISSIQVKPRRKRAA